MIRKDKKKHFVAGFAVALITALFLISIKEPISILPLISAGFVGVLKEVVYDKLMGRGDVEFADFTWTLAGGTILNLLTLLL